MSGVAKQEGTGIMGRKDGNKWNIQEPRSVCICGGAVGGGGGWGWGWRVWVTVCLGCRREWGWCMNEEV